MRKPSLHITEEQLKIILSELRDDGVIKFSNKAKLPELILKLAKNISLNNRLVTVNNNRVEKKIEKILTTKKSDIDLLASLIFKIRKAKKHKGISRIKTGTAEYTQLRDLSEITINFCNDFGLSRKEGFQTYITLGINRISSFRNLVSKLIKMSDSIFEIYEANQIINNDNNTIETESIYNYYVGIISQKTGLVIELRDKPQKYKYFVAVRELTDKLNIDYKVYMDAQFDGLEWTSGYPEPNQLVGDNAILRLNKYLYKKKLKLNSRDKEDSDKVNFLLKLKNKQR